MGSEDQRPRLHPAPGHASFVPRLGHGQQRLLPLLAGRGITTTVSPLHFMEHNRELALFASGDAPIGLALDPSTHFRQLPIEHRGVAFRRETFGNDPAFRPDEHLDLGSVEALGQEPLDRQRARGATLLMTTYHVTGSVGSRGRALDLELCRVGVAHFRTERMDQPALHAAVQLPREIFATIAIERGVVASPLAVEALVAAYAELEVDGYWVKIEGFDQRAPMREIKGGCALLGALSETGRPVVSCGPGGLHVALLVAEISSSLGLGEGERFALPDARRPRREGPRPRSVYHPGLLRSFQAGARPVERAFSVAPCRCGRHPSRFPPSGGAVDEHCALVRAREAREAVSGTYEERLEWLQAAASLASHLGHDAGVDVVPSDTLAAVREAVAGGRGREAETA